MPRVLEYIILNYLKAHSLYLNAIIYDPLIYLLFYKLWIGEY